MYRAHATLVAFGDRSASGIEVGFAAWTVGSRALAMIPLVPGLINSWVNTASVSGCDATFPYHSRCTTSFLIFGQRLPEDSDLVPSANSASKTRSST